MGDHYDQKPWLKFYDKHVPANLTYPEKPVWDLLSEAFVKFPDRKALYYMGTGFTYHQLDVMSNKFANYLQKNKISKGDVVGVNLPNLPAYYVAMLGTLKAGCVLSGVSPLLSAEELKNQLIDSGAKVLVTLDALFLPRIKPMVSQTQVKHVIATSIGDYLSPIMAFMGKRMKKFPTGKIEQVPGINVLSFKELMSRMPADPVHTKVYMDDTCVMQYTGGTTGLPKGAELTQRNIMSQITQINTWLDAPMGQYVGLTAFPLFHIAGLIIGMASFAKAVTLIAVPNPRDQEFIIGCMKKYKPDIVGNVPTVFLELMKQPKFKALDFSKIRYFASGAAPFPPENIKEFEKIIGGPKLVEVYGLTETSPIITALPLYGAKKPGSAGIPFPDTEIKMVDPSTGEVVPFGEAGELVVKGPQVFTKGYFKRPEETANALRDGWFHTGDIGKMDEEGYCFIVDRLKDMVNVSGFKVFTRELDDVICEYPDVYMGATVGIPDPERPGSEIVASAIVLKPGIEKSDAEKVKIVEYIRGKVAPYKVPKKLEFMDELPTSAVGKVLKRELRSKFKSEIK